MEIGAIGAPDCPNIFYRALLCGFAPALAKNIAALSWVRFLRFEPHKTM
ncbi:hypothetical protein RB2083_324 [Rhodobacteraceae bacterium HTCC2083]|nr:hypothetical protein RB2083_324 [Rhodobacteraceae bacterium HTCC2083]